MLAWIWNIIVGQFCTHKWKVINEGKIFNQNNDPIGDIYALQCQKCGDITKREI